MPATTAPTERSTSCPLCRFEAASLKGICEEHGSTAMLVFKLPENQEEHCMAVNGGRYYSALRNIDQQCRGWLKHGHSFKDADEALAAVRQLIADEEVLD